MRATIFKQYKEPWAPLPFPKGNTVKGCGCGLCSVTHILIEDERYKDYTPATVRPYMVKYAVRNQGLQHVGIPSTLKHYGLENVKEFGRAATMKQIFEECGEGGRLGVILFYKQNAKGKTITAKGPDGTVWTEGGHFIAFTGYKVENGKHYFYMKDSGGRNHDGWYCYEKSMAGCVWKVWTCTVPNPAKKDTSLSVKKTYTGELPNPTVTEKKTVTVSIDNTKKIAATAKALAWPKGTKATKYAYKGGSPTAVYKAAYKKAYPDRSGWSAGPAAGCACDVYGGTVARVSGIDKDFPRGATPAIRSYTSKTMTKFIYRNVSPYSVSRDGDIVIYFKDKAGKHAHEVVRADGVIYEAQLRMTYPHVNTSLSKLKTKRPIVVVYRAKATTRTETQTVSRSYLRKGDSGSEVKKLQAVINWYDANIKNIIDKKLSEDGIFGVATESALKALQKVLNITVDGKAGSETVSAIKKAVK